MQKKLGLEWLIYYILAACSLAMNASVSFIFVFVVAKTTIIILIINWSMKRSKFQVTNRSAKITMCPYTQSLSSVVSSSWVCYFSF